MGRYFERSEHYARYCKVQFNSSLDAPVALDKHRMLNSMLLMSDSFQAYHEKYNRLADNSVFKFIALDQENPYSIQAMVGLARENSRSVRNLLVSEVWEASNKFYRSLDSYQGDRYKAERAYDFYQHVIDNVYIIKGIIGNTLLRDDMAALIYLGMYMERAIQISRIILAKLDDISALPPERLGTPLENFHWTNLLRSCGGFDTSRRIYRSVMNRQKSLEFLLLNRSFPKSIAFSTQEANVCFEILNLPSDKKNDSPVFKMGKIVSALNYLEYREIEGKETVYFTELLGKIYQITQQFEREYLG
jgi:uncharacterized alpha-E superfamily protein